MKLFRRLSALVMALMLVLSLSIGVLAADFDNMADGFAYDGEDTEVNINLKADDEYGYYEAKEGKTYNISSDNGSALLSSSLGGSGTVNIDGAALDYWLFAEEQVDVTINGDVEGSLYACGQSEVTVNGDAGSSIYACDQAEVTINGDVNGIDGKTDYVDFSDPISSIDGSFGVAAYNESTVIVAGNVTGGDGYGTCGWGGTGVSASNQATVTVGGDVIGGNVIADPNTKAYTNENGYTYQSNGGDAVEAYHQATVTVGGDVIGGSTNGDKGESGNGISIFSLVDLSPTTVTVTGTVSGGKAENGIDADGIYIKLEEGAAAPIITVSGYDSASGIIVTHDEQREDFVYVRDLTEAELEEILTGNSPNKPAASEVNYGTSFYYSRGRLINEHGVSVRALFAFGNDWEETVENGTVTITSAEKQGEIVVTVESLKVMMDVGIETILFNGTKLVLKDAVAERSAYDTYTITASAILLNGAAV